MAKKNKIEFADQAEFDRVEALVIKDVATRVKEHGADRAKLFEPGKTVKVGGADKVYLLSQGHEIKETK
jgi:hypothetical protein